MGSDGSSASAARPDVLSRNCATKSLQALGADGSLLRQAGEGLADRRRELEAVAAARRAHDDSPVSLEDEALVRGGRVEARLGTDRYGVCGRTTAFDPPGQEPDGLLVGQGLFVRIGERACHV